MAELYARSIGMNAESAGLYAQNGTMISFGAERALAAHGIDASHFRSRQFTAEAAAQADLIAGVSASCCCEIVRRCPEAEGKTVLLLEYSSGGDVADPFGGNESVYRHCLEQMIPAVENLFATINSNITKTEVKHE